MVFVNCREYVEACVEYPGGPGRLQRIGLDGSRYMERALSNFAAGTGSPFPQLDAATTAKLQQALTQAVQKYTSETYPSLLANDSKLSLNEAIRHFQQQATLLRDVRTPQERADNPLSDFNEKLSLLAMKNQLGPEFGAILRRFPN
jgi:hypothetical protein